MAFTGGPLSVVGIVPSYTSNLGQQTSSTGVVQAQNQVWQGVGQSFVGKPGQPLTGRLTSSVVNVALNSESLQNFIGPNGNTLFSGSNIKAPSLNGFLGGSQSSLVNRQIGTSLSNAGPFGSVFSRGGASSLAAVASLAAGAAGVGGGALGAVAGAVNYIMFPGAGNEGASNYAGIPYNLQDVTFSLQPANRGPQSFGTSQSTSFPKSMTTLPFNEYTSMPPLAGSPTANALKSSSMVGDLSTKAFTPGAASSGNFNTSLNLF